jgi:hypothetical protein
VLKVLKVTTVPPTLSTFSALGPEMSIGIAMAFVAKTNTIAHKNTKIFFT